MKLDNFLIVPILLGAAISTGCSHQRVNEEKRSVASTESAKTIYFTFNKVTSKLKLSEEILAQIKKSGYDYLECFGATSDQWPKHLGAKDDDWKEYAGNAGAYVHLMLGHRAPYWALSAEAVTPDERIASATTLFKNLDELEISTELWKSGWGSGPKLSVFGEEAFENIFGKSEQAVTSIEVEKEGKAIPSIIDGPLNCSMYYDD